MTRPNNTLQRGIAGGLILLVALMPFHAFLSVWLGSFTHHQAIIQAWKEALLVVLAALTIVLVWHDAPSRDRLRTWPVILAGAFAVLAFAVTAVTRPSLTAVAFGAKTDLEFLVAFVIAVVVASPGFVRNLTWAILIPACVVTGFGLLQSTLLPADFLTHFGYGPSTIAPYQVLDPAVKSLRFASTLGGPNQLGTYLMLPLALAAVLAVRRRHWAWLVLVAGGLVVLLHTYSRAAWLGAALAAVIVVLVLAPARLRSRLGVLFALLGLAAALAADWLLTTSGKLQYYIFHSSRLWDNARGSDFQHLMSLRTGLTDTLHRPLGHGLGTAGPAVFHSGAGVIIENNYLQISYETGIPGVLVFGALALYTGVILGARAGRSDLAAATLAALAGISITALFLPAWTDSSTALILWTAAGGVIGLSPDTRHV